MRKVYQACLAAIALLSLGALVVYRHEYNRLHYVLEVLNYFGNQEGVRCNKTWITESKNKFYGSEVFGEPIPSWQRLTDEIYLYSAYRADVGEVRVVGVAKSEKSHLSTLSCQVFFLRGYDIESRAGKLSYHSINSSAWKNEKNDTFEGVNFMCNFPEEKNEENVVTAVGFSRKSDTEGENTSHEEIMVFVSVKELNSDRSSEQKRSSSNEDLIGGACVLPGDPIPLSYKTILSFAITHTSFGIDQFIVYDFGGIAQKFNFITKGLLPENSVVPLPSRLPSYTTIPWNFPFSKVPSNVIRKIGFTDCLYRTHGKMDFVVALTWDEKMALKYHSTIAKLLLDFDKNDYGADRYKIRINNFCLDRTNEPPKVVTYKKLADADPIFIYRQSKGSKLKNHSEADITTRDVDSDLMSVNRYEECSPSGKKYDSRVVSGDTRYFGKFSELLQKSDPVKLSEE